MNALFGCCRNLFRLTIVAALCGLRVTAEADVIYASNWAVNGATGQGSISKIDSNGNVSTFVSGLTRPEGLAFDSEGNLYVALQKLNVIEKIDSLGVVSTFASLTVPSDQGLAGIAFDVAGNLYVSIQDGHTFLGSIDKISPSGDTVSVFASGVVTRRLWRSTPSEIFMSLMLTTPL